MYRALICTSLFFSLSLTAVPQFSTYVSAESPLYEYIERLESRRCALPTLRALGPQSYFDLRTAVDLPEAPAREAEDGTPIPGRCDIPQWLRKERALMRLRAAQPLSVWATPFLLHFDSLPLTGLEASVTPLYPLRGGRPFFNGPNLDLELTLGGEFNRNGFGFSGGITPGFVTGLEDYSSVRGKFYLYEGYLKVGYQWAELVFGRTQLRFGQTAHGSLLLSGAAKPVDLLKFAIRPHILGTPFSFLGPFSFETWVSGANDSAFVTGARFWGISLGARPLTWLEFAFLELYQFGGAGAPGLQFGDALKMLAYVGDDDLKVKRQRAFAFHLALWGPSQTFKLYTQLSFESLSSPSSWFSDEISPLIGLWIPRVGEADFRLEYVHTVPNAFRDGFWKQGLSYQGTPLGHPIGPDGEALYLDVGLPPVGLFRFGLTGSYEVRQKNPTAGQATDYRYGGGLELRSRWIRTELAAGMRFTHASADQYIPGNAVDNGAGYVMIKYTFY